MNLQAVLAPNERSVRDLYSLRPRPHPALREFSQDAARVCNSLARCNVKVLGESRVALTRSVSRIEQLDTRMSGTMRAFARLFGGPAP